MGAAFFASLMVASLGGCSLLKPKPKKPLGADCTDDLGCDSMTCSTSGNICSHSCTYDKDCKDVSADAVCRRKDEGGNWCSKPIGTAPNGSCMAANDCQHNECLKYVGKEDQPGICSKYCASADDCPAGMKICVSISDSGLLKVCIPGDPSTAASGNAAASFAPARKPSGTAPARPHAAPPPPPHAAPAPPPASHPPAKKH